MQARSFQVKVDHKDAQTTFRKDDRDVGERHCSPDPAFVRIEGNDRTHILTESRITHLTDFGPENLSKIVNTFIYPGIVE